MNSNYKASFAVELYDRLDKAGYVNISIQSEVRESETVERIRRLFKSPEGLFYTMSAEKNSSRQPRFTGEWVRDEKGPLVRGELTIKVQLKFKDTNSDNKNEYLLHS